MVARDNLCVIAYKNVTKWYAIKCNKLKIKSDMKQQFYRIFGNKYYSFTVKTSYIQFTFTKKTRGT